ncbi:Isochorismatase hydrolase [Thozetella sp. PMI_491]|nr:Isochorismatase hydrolase [Thozetella sp. PMI_491]
MVSSVNLILALTASCVAGLSAEKRQDGTLGIVGNAYNYWRSYENGTYDLTRRDVSPITSPKLIPMTGMRTSVIIEPSRSVLCIIDMQNYFLHPVLAPTSEDGRAAVDPTINLVKSFRSNGIKVAWVNWGLTNFDLLMLPPSVKSGFSNNVSMGVYQYKNETIDAGPRLMAGSWNVEPYGKLKQFVKEGVEAGTDLEIPKNRLSGLWGAQTPFGMFLQQNEITTIFIAGVDADQCVRTTFMDSYFKGYDPIYVDDLAATRNGKAAYENTRFTANYTGFIANSLEIIKAIRIGNGTKCKEA